MLEKEIHDFRYHEFKTDSDTIIRDLAGLMSLGVSSEEIEQDGEVVKKALPSMEYTWQIVYPAPDFTLVTNRQVICFEDLSQEEYLMITNDQLSKVVNKATVRAKVLAQTDINIDRVNNKNLAAKDVYKYVQLYMPRYLCDTEVTDPFAQDRDVNLIPKLLNPRTGRADAIIRNYHWLLMRSFDVPTEDFSGPQENKRDLTTGEFTEFNSAPSEWTKIAWFTDFEEKFASEVHDSLVSSSLDSVLRVPVSASLTNKTKLSVRANFHPSRLVLNLVGNPNVDYGDNRYLISMAYIGAIDSFKGSKDDVEGNFGIFTSSCSNASISASQSISLGTFSGLNKDDQGNALVSGESWKFYNQSPGKIEVSNAIETDVKAYVDIATLPDINVASIDANGNVPGVTTYSLTYRKRNIPADISIFSDGGETSIDANSVRTTFSTKDNQLEFDFVFEYGAYSLGDYRNTRITISVPVNDLTSSRLPLTTKLISDPGSLVETIEVTMKNDDFYKFLHRYLVAELTVLGAQWTLNPRSIATQRVRMGGSYYTSSWSGSLVTMPNRRLKLGFNEQGTILQTVNVTERDKYGNVLVVNYPATFGMHTANGTTDFAMYKTDSSDYWQSHFLMFSTSEQFMKKHMYGKSAYTGEYFADRIKVTHSAEGVRGVLSGLITIDAESLFAFDELIVNKDYEKYQDKAEETYIYIPITAAYCPFANSPNERNGIGLLKEVKLKDYDDNSKLHIAMDKLTTYYIDSFYHFNETEGLYLLDQIDGIEIEWHCDSPVIFNPQEQELIEPEPPAAEPEPPVAETPNSAPVLKGANNGSIVIGTSFNPLEGVTATDDEDGDITHKIVIASNNLDIDTIGDYIIRYEVTDSEGLMTHKNRSIAVIE